MEKSFDEQCFDTVRFIAGHLDDIAANPRNREDVESRIEELEDDIACLLEDTLSEDDEAYFVELEEEKCELQELLDSGEELNLYDYFEDCLDIEYIVGGDGSYRGAVICIATGGPHIEVNTRDECVNLYWGGTKKSYYINRDTANQIDDIFQEYYNCL